MLSGNPSVRTPDGTARLESHDLVFFPTGCDRRSPEGEDNLIVPWSAGVDYFEGESNA